jgi:hypothetical protein
MKDSTDSVQPGVTSAIESAADRPPVRSESARPIPLLFALSEQDARSVARLLNLLDGHLTSGLKSLLPPGDPERESLWLKPCAERDYADRREARRLRLRLLAALRRETANALRKEAR